MPEKLHRKLEAQVKNKPWSKERKDKYVYGTLFKIKEKMRKLKRR